ncbi:DUF3047 domain-containing protein [Candidatus Omnitrophota bacterium]
MKRQGRNFIIVSLIAAVIAIALGVSFIVVKEKLKGATGKAVKEFPFTSQNSLKEWEVKVLTKNSTGYTLAEHDGKNCVKAESKDSASALYSKQRLFWESDPFVSWDWKAEKFPERTKKETLKKKEEFDFVAQVYVIFYARFFLNMQAIQYVWTENIPEGEASSSPYTKKVKLMVLQSGPSEGWVHEERDIREDYKKLFGAELNKNVAAISFMTDSDSTGTTASAYFTNIKVGYLDKDPEKREAEAKPGWLSRFKDNWLIKKIMEFKRKEQPSDT